MGTPLKINGWNMSSWRWKVQIIFLSFHGWFVGEPAVNLPGCNPQKTTTRQTSPHTQKPSKTTEVWHFRWNHWVLFYYTPKPSQVVGKNGPLKKNRGRCHRRWGIFFLPTNKHPWVKNGAKRRTRNGGVWWESWPGSKHFWGFFFLVCFKLMDFWLVFVGKTDFQNRCQDGRPFVWKAILLFDNFLCSWCWVDFILDENPFWGRFKTMQICGDFVHL